VLRGFGSLDRMDIVARCALMLAIICGTLWPLPAAEASDRVYVTNLGGSLSIYNSATERSPPVSLRPGSFQPPSPSRQTARTRTSLCWAPTGSW
jgi:hypothetical protein